MPRFGARAVMMEERAGTWERLALVPCPPNTHECAGRPKRDLPTLPVRHIRTARRDSGAPKKQRNAHAIRWLQPPRAQKATYHTTRWTPPHVRLHTNVYGPRPIWAGPMPTVRPSLEAAHCVAHRQPAAHRTAHSCAAVVPDRSPVQAPSSAVQRTLAVTTQGAVKPRR